MGRPLPFGETVVAPWHVERPETARVLGELERRVARARQTGALVACPGLGRTHLLRVLSQRTDPTRWQCLYLPQASFDFSDLCRFTVGLATGRCVSGSPEAALRELLHDVWQEGRSLLVMMDDADSMPGRTARDWLDLTIEHVPSLLSIFVTRDDHVAPCVSALEEEAPIVRFDTPMSEPETCEYVLDRLSRVGAGPELLARFDEAVVERLYQLSGGLPVRLHAIAQAYTDMPASSSGAAADRLSEVAAAMEDAEPEDWSDEPGARLALAGGGRA